ncbi:MAG: hypothetical protein ACTSP4_08675 [Candidatus Hodarchaeales archaeon]
MNEEEKDKINEELEEQEEERIELEEELNEMENEMDDFGHPHPPPPPLPPLSPHPRSPRPPHPPRFHPFHRRNGMRKNVTIRGIDRVVYREFSKAMKILGLNIGEAITKMMKDVLHDNKVSAKSFQDMVELPHSRIEHHSELTVNASDLVEANRRFSFNNIETLILGPDITADILKRHVRSINNCSMVRYPSTLPKLLLYSKVRLCDSLEMYAVPGKESTEKGKEE